LSALRERQKLMRREAILEAARKLFGRHGFVKTNMQEIADEAAVGVATVYKYFGSKNGVLQGLFEPEFARIEEAAAQVLADPPSDPAQGMVALLERYRITSYWADRDLLRPLAVDYLAASNRYTVFQEFEPLLRGHITQLIRAYQKRGRLKPRLDRDQVAEIVIAIMLLGFHRYIADPRATRKELRVDLDTKLRLLFADWRAR